MEIKTFKMKKTIKEWFETLEEPYRTQALFNIPEKLKSGEVDCLSFALAIGFVWEDSPEEDEYWKELYDKLEAEGR